MFDEDYKNSALSVKIEPMQAKSKALPVVLNELENLLFTNQEYLVEDQLNKNKVAELAHKYDVELIDLLASNESTRKLFFVEINNSVLVFNKDKFIQFISNKEFLPDSYTTYKNKIGLASGNDLLSEHKEVVLNWAYKDCVLEGGQDKEDAKRNEVFYNKVLAPDQIDRLLDDKVFTNFRIYDKDGEHNVTTLTDSDNLIIRGNNLLALHSLKKRYAGKVKLIYIDPPYNTGTDSFGYNDKFNHSSWLTFMKNRLEVARKLLTTDGAIFIQCDDNEQAYLTVLLDQIFGIENRINTICVNMSTVSGNKIKHTIDGKRFPKTKEYILLYAKNKSSLKLTVPKSHKSKWDGEYNKIVPEWTQADYKLLEEATIDEINDRLKSLSLQSLTDYAKENHIQLTDKWKWDNAYRIFAVEQNESLRKIARTVDFDTDIGCVKSSQGLLKLISTQYNKESSRARIELVSAQENGQMFLSDNWTDMAIGGGISYEGSVTLKSGKKPEKLLHRVIEAATEPGDLVLDYHVGTGTTAAVAHKMGRRYIGIEQLFYGENDPTVRLKNVIKGDQTGISKTVKWSGGGSFIYCQLMDLGNKFVESVKEASTDKELVELLEQAKKSSFLSYKVDPEKINPGDKDFTSLSTAHKKQLLMEIVDHNHLYVNYSEIDDSDYGVSASDMVLNKQFYEN